MTSEKRFQPGRAVVIHQQYSPEIAPLHGRLVQYPEFLSGEKFPFHGRLQKAPGRAVLLKVTVLWDDGMGSCLKDGRGQWKGMAMKLCSYNVGGK